MPSHIDPAIFVHANIGDKRVILRARAALALDKPSAVGHLVLFWGRASMAVEDGNIAEIPDDTLEEWACWTGARGAFARFIREHHADASGRINEWTEYAGKLSRRRTLDRERQRRRREQLPTGSDHPAPSGRDMSRGRPCDSHADVTRRERDMSRGESVTKPGTEQRAEKLEVRSKSNSNSRESAAAADAGQDPAQGAGEDALALTIAANQAIAVRFGEQPSPIIATHGTSHAVATALRAAGIPAAFGADVIADVVARTQFKRPPRSLGYFRAAIEEAWDAQQAHAQARSAPRETSGAPNVRTAVGEYAPDVIRRRAEWWERLCFDRGWNHESSLAREGLLYSLEACGDVRDRAGFLAEWQVLKPHVDADLYRERTRGAVVAFFAEVLAAAVPPGAGPAAASAPARVAAEAAS